MEAFKAATLMDFVLRDPNVYNKYLLFMGQKMGELMHNPEGEKAYIEYVYSRTLESNINTYNPDQKTSIERI